jgi:hypothetical protein
VTLTLRNSDRLRKIANLALEATNVGEAKAAAHRFFEIVKKEGLTPDDLLGIPLKQTGSDKHSHPIPKFPGSTETLHFGKHRGATWGETVRRNYSYILWIRDSFDFSRNHRLLRVVNAGITWANTAYGWSDHHCDVFDNDKATR